LENYNLPPLKFTPICNSGVNVSIASIAPQKVSKIYNPPLSV